MKVWAFGVGVIGLTAAVLSIQGQKPMAMEAANKFLSSLTADQKSKASKTFSDDYRTKWNYVPISREGIHLGDLTPEQAELATALLKTSLSDAGMKRVETIKGLEDVLKAQENNNPGRDKRLYTFTFFGEPTMQGKWGWRYEGHHVSLNFTYNNGALISSTPQFFGSNPAEVRTGPQKGLRALPQEDDLGFAMLNSLTDDQKAKAILTTNAPGDIVTTNTRKAAIQSNAGLAYKDLTSSQKASLMKLLRVYAESQTPPEAKRRWGRVENDSIVFAWMGGTKPGTGHYYRIQGSKVLVEFDNTQHDANHIHSVWRDFDGDFGEDVLAEHYAQFHR